MASNQAISAGVNRSRTLRWPRYLSRATLYLLVAAGAAASMFPLFWTLMTAGKDIPEMFTYPPSFVPAQPHYVEILTALFTNYPFGHWLANSFYITIFTAPPVVPSASLPAYSFPRFPDSS